MSETNNSEKSKRNLESIINGTNWVALGVVLVAVVGLICVVFNLLTKTEENNAPKEILIKYEITVENVSLKNAKDSTTLRVVQSIDENNKKILSEINSSVDAQYKRMESILSVQEDRSRLFSYGAGFLAILVAIATFFGFKSINEMKKSTIEAAEYEAKKVAGEKAKEVAGEKAKEVAELIAKEISEKEAKIVATETATSVAEKQAKQVATETAKKIAEEVGKSEVRERLKDIKKHLKSQLELEFKNKFEQIELAVSDEWENKLKEDFKESLKKVIEDLESVKVRVQQFENDNDNASKKREGKEEHTLQAIQEIELEKPEVSKPVEKTLSKGTNQIDQPLVSKTENNPEPSENNLSETANLQDTTEVGEQDKFPTDENSDKDLFDDNDLNN